jgi:adenylate kinase
MRIAVTGTPGTGKTTATDLLGEDPTDECEASVIHLNDVIREESLYTDTDTERDSLITDFDSVADWLDENDNEGVTIVESHLAHHFDAERVVVLRCHPEKLEERLRERGESDAKVSENAEAEALDVILTEAVDRHGEESVYEIDTTDNGPAAVAREIESVIAGEREPSAGEVNFVGYL